MEENKTKKKVEKKEEQTKKEEPKKTQPKKTSKKTTSKTTKTTSEKKSVKESTAKKTTSEKKETTKKTTKKKTTPKKTATTSAKEETLKPIKKTQVKEEKVKEEKIKEENKVDLEKTIIFDGVQNKNIKDVIDKLEEQNVVLEDKVIKRSKVNKIIIIVLIFMILAVIAGTTYYVVKDQIAKNENKQTLNSNIYKKVSKNYPSEEIDVDKNNNSNQNEIKYSNIETISLSQFESLSLKQEDMVILVASETCYACLNFEPIVNEVFKELDKTIYRIDITSFTNEETERFRTYYAFRKTPTIFIVKAGIVTSEHIGSMEKDDLASWLKENL